MDTQIFKNMITIIKNEQEQRSSQLKDIHPDIAYDQWLFKDQPFINELCMMVLVTLRHQVERELVGLAAQADESDKEISGQQYHEKVKQLRKTNKEGKNIGWDWKEIKKRLNLEDCEKHEITEALRHLSNSYKHDPSIKPNEELIKLLHLETEVNYAPLLESDALREGIANFVRLGKNADYCDITERFVDITCDFLSIVRNRTKLCKIKWGKVSFHPNDIER